MTVNEKVSLYMNFLFFYFYFRLCRYEGFYYIDLFMKKITDEDPKVTFGKTIRGIRILKRLTQDNLSELSGKAPVYISNLERGQSNPTLDSILTFAAALEVEPSDIFALAFSSESDLKKEIKAQFATILSRSTDAELKLILKILTAIVEK